MEVRTSTLRCRWALRLAACALWSAVPIAQSATAPAVVLFDAGAAARQEMRYTARAGDRFSRQFTVRLTLAAIINGVQIPAPPRRRRYPC